MNWFFAIASIIFALLSWTIIAIISNYVAARKIGLPIIISPVSPLNPLWIITYRTFPSVLSLSRLPFGLGTWARCTFLGWSFKDKHALHDELGRVFVIVTPGGNEVTMADPQATHDILSHRKEFIKPAAMYGMGTIVMAAVSGADESIEQLNVFGPNLNTVEGKDWERQRRLTAPNFNERTSSLVWNEALRQVHDMSRSWADQGVKGTRETVPDTATIALHVLTSVGFGLSYPFHGGVRDLPQGHSMTYRDALSMCLRNIITFAIFPKRVLSMSLVPKRLRSLGVAAKEFQRYMEEMLTHERSVAAQRESRGGNLISSLVRASEEAQKSKDSNDSTLLGFTDEEIFGNIFAFNLAGHETTANTLATSLVLLAANPDCQDWLIEEVHRVLNGPPLSGDWKYEEAFPKLQRCLAVMYETLRLYGSIVFIPKSTGFHPQSLTLRDRTHVLPPNTAVNINVQALHTEPQIWGTDALEWRPSRWFKDTGKPTAQSSKLEDDTFIEPETGTFIPWADGPRACVGRKFSQVEFVAVLAGLFHRYRVGPVLENGESEAEGKRVLSRMAENSAISAITLQMLEPRARALRWEEQPI